MNDFDYLTFSFLFLLELIMRLYFMNGNMLIMFGKMRLKEIMYISFFLILFRNILFFYLFYFFILIYSSSSLSFLIIKIV